jgi:hypothetical protein
MVLEQTNAGVSGVFSLEVTTYDASAGPTAIDGAATSDPASVPITLTRGVITGIVASALTNTKAGATAVTNTFKFNIPNSIPLNGWVKVVFPDIVGPTGAPNFELTADGTTKCGLASAVGFVFGSAWDTASRTLSVQLFAGCAAGFNLEMILEQTNAGVSGVFSLEVTTYDASAGPTAIDGAATSDPALVPITLTRGVITGIVASALTATEAGATAVTNTFKFNIPNAIPSNGWVKVVFPNIVGSGAAPNFELTADGTTKCGFANTVGFVFGSACPCLGRTSRFLI